MRTFQQKKNKKKEVYFANTLHHLISNTYFLKFCAQQSNIVKSLKMVSIYLIFSLFLCPPKPQ